MGRVVHGLWHPQLCCHTEIMLLGHELTLHKAKTTGQVHNSTASPPPPRAESLSFSFLMRAPVKVSHPVLRAAEVAS
jgi:hypothetical protein